MIKPALRVGSDRSTLREEMVCLDRKLHRQPGMVDGEATATAQTQGLSDQGDGDRRRQGRASAFFCTDPGA